MSTPDSKSSDTLYFDGQCALCASEISELRERRGEQLNLVDIHDLGAQSAEGNGQDGERLERCTPCAQARNKDQLLRTLHLHTADGKWLTGADANVAAWQGTRRGNWLTVLRWPVLRHIVDLVYSIWAWWRYRRLYGDQFEEKQHAPAKR